MSLRINDEIPNLKVTTDQGELSLHDYHKFFIYAKFYSKRRHGPLRTTSRV